MKNTNQPHAALLQKFSRLLPEEELNRLATETGFMVRKARKLTPLHFVVSFFMALSQRLTSLSGWTGQLFSLSGALLSKQGLNGRLTKEASAFAQKVFEALLRQRCRITKEVGRVMKNFSSVLVQDSSAFGLREGLKESFKGNVSKGVQKAVMRLKAIVELSALKVVETKVTSYCENDQSAASNIHRFLRASALVIRDLGYWSVDSFKKILGRGAYFLSRYKWGVKLYTPSGGELPLPTLLNGRAHDRWVRLSRVHPLAVRLLIIPVPAQVAEQRVRKAKKNRDRRLHHAQEYYRSLAYDIFVTNVGAPLCTARELQQLYRLRWQIEVLFRALKSGALNLQEMLRPIHKNAQRVRTVALLSLCFLALALQQLYEPFTHRIHEAADRWLSLTKVLRWWMSNLLLFAYLQTEDLQPLLVQYCCYEKRKRKCLPEKLSLLT
jgi:Transposase DDE domain